MRGLFFVLFCWFALAGCAAVGTRPDASVGDLPSKGPVGRTMKASSQKFANCARDAVTVQTGSTQHVQLHFTVDAEGKVLNAKILKMDEPDPDLYSCILKVLKHVEFPKPKDGEPHEVDYPLTLQPE